MGEIATWSAVKTKVGLGKDSNECPTKAELLALSPTGTGESYVGLEISNASSYGDNETVQLSDIHKVTYVYSFYANHNLLTYSASGGLGDPRSFTIYSNKYKYLDGVLEGYENRNLKYTAFDEMPEFIYYGDGYYRAFENEELTERVGYIRYRQSESNKELTITFKQEAATSTWEYVLQKSNFWSDEINVFTALGGTVVSGTDPAAPMGNSYKQEYRNGHTYGSPVKVPVKVSVDVNWITLKETTINDISTDTLTQTATENKSETTRKGILTFTQEVSGKKFTVNRNQAAGVKTYGNIIITPTSEITDIPAAGGSSGIFTYSYSQPWGWNGKTTEGGTITSGATASWSNAVSGSNLGTTVKARTKLGIRTLTLTQNGKSGTATKDVYQAENKIVSTSQGAWEVSISANPSTFTEQGGTSQISASARAPRTNTWSSGATNAASDATGTPTLSIPIAVTGFSLSGTTLTVAENATPNQRSVVVRATMSSVYKEVTVTQSAYLVEWKYYLTTSTPTLNFDALGTTKEGTLTSYREKYINGSLVDGSRENVNATYKSGSTEIQSATQTVTTKVAITMKENTTTKARTGTVVYEQVGSGKTITITCNQVAGTVTTREVLSVDAGDVFPNVIGKGGTTHAFVISGYYDVINGKDTTWHREAPTLKSKPDFVSTVNIEYFPNVNRYQVEAIVSENTSSSSRNGTVVLEYGSKTLSLDITQMYAIISWNYVFNIKYPGSKVLLIDAKPGSRTIEVYSYRIKVVNGEPTTLTEPVDVTVDSVDENWVKSIIKDSQTNDQVNFIVTVLENSTTNTREALATFRQVGTTNSTKVTISQAAATVTTRDVIDWVEPLPSNNVGASKSILELNVTSYRETLINGTVSSKIVVIPTVDLHFEGATSSQWASVKFTAGNPNNYEYIIRLTVEENTTNQTRSASIMPKNGSAEPENSFEFTQDAATISTRYEIFWRLSDADGNTDKVTEIELNGSASSDAVDMIVIMNKITTINGKETSTPIGTYTEENSLRLSGGNLNVQLGSYSRGIAGIFDLGFQLQTSQDNLEATAYTISASLIASIKDGNVEVGNAPTFTIKVLPVPYQRVFEFSWKSEGSLISNVVLNGDIMNSDSVASRDIISYESLRRNGVEFSRRYIKPTLIPPSVDWVQVIDNGQSADNSYNYAIRALTDNESDSARITSARFEQPGNGNQALSLYISQDLITVEKLECELGNYYSYGDNNLILMGFNWQSPDGSDSINGMTTAGGYLGAHAECKSGNYINMNVIGKPQYSKPLKIKVGNIRRVKEGGWGADDEVTLLKISTRSGTDVDYVAESAFMNNFSQYFETSLNIINPTSGTGGTLQIEISLKNTYNGSPVNMQDWTFKPKNPNDPLIHLLITWGDY